MYIDNIDNRLGLGQFLAQVRILPLELGGRTAETILEVPGEGKGTRKIGIVLDQLEATRSEILYCVECPGHDEW